MMTDRTFFITDCDSFFIRAGAAPGAPSVGNFSPAEFVPGSRNPRVRGKWLNFKGLLGKVKKPLIDSWGIVPSGPIPPWRILVSSSHRSSSF